MAGLSDTRETSIETPFGKTSAPVVVGTVKGQRLAFLARHGDPFDRIGTDPESRVQLALGSSGVPESFIIDGRGIIRYQHMGPIEPDDVPTILREWEAAK